MFNEHWWNAVLPPWRTQSELFALGRSFELMLAALGGDRDRVGDAIYGAKTMSLMAVKVRKELWDSIRFHNASK